MRTKSWLGARTSGAVGVGAVALLLGCSEGPFEAKPDQSGGAGGGGGAGNGWGGLGGGDAGVPATECDPSAADEPDADFVDSNCDGVDGDAKAALFVSPLGSDEAEGSRQAPLATLGRAIVLAAEDGHDVYVCSATYEENVVIEKTGVHVFGGYACNDGWRRTPERAVVAPRTGAPLRLHDLDEKNDVSFENFEFWAQAAVLPGESSVAAVVVHAQAVRFEHVALRTGSGAEAGPAPAPNEYTSGADAGMAGGDAPNVDHCWEDYRVCSDNLCLTLTRLKASCAATLAKVPQPWKCASGQECRTACPTSGGKAVYAERGVGSHGGNGFEDLAAGAVPKPRVVAHSGEAGRTGAPADVGFGALSPDGQYVASNVGTPGAFGYVGTMTRGAQGAVGSVSVGSGEFAFMTDRIGGAGGSSGKPGCGGYPGSHGLAGGASVGLIVIDSVVELERVSITTDTGGLGGVPLAGGAGQRGGAGGRGGLSSSGQVANERAPSGAAGGNGGPGGAGGPGAGGPSVGIVVSGAVPTLRAVKFDIGPGGRGSQPLPESGVGPAANGISADVFVVPMLVD